MIQKRKYFLKNGDSIWYICCDKNTYSSCWNWLKPITWHFPIPTWWKRKRRPNDRAEVTDFPVIGGTLTIPFEFSLLWIHHLFRESTYNSISLSRIHSQFPTFFANTLTIPFKFSLLWIHHLFCDFTFHPRIHFEFIFFREFTISFANLQSPLWIYFEFSIFFANPLRILYFFLEFTLNSLLFSRMSCQFTIYLQWLMMTHDILQFSY